MAAGRVSENKVVRMRAWFARHKSDLKAAKNSDPQNDKYPGPGAVAWLLWGGNPTSNAMQAHDWADRTINDIENAKSAPRARANSDEDEALREAHLRRVGKAEKKMNGKLRRFMMDQRAKIIRYLEENPPTASGERATNETGAGEFDWITFGSLLNPDIADAFSASFVAGYDETETPIDTDALEYQENRLPKIAELVADERAGFVQASGQALAAKLNQSILKSYEDGENLRDTIKGVRKTMNTGLSRARTIARTESNIASTGGLELQAETVKMKYKKWISEGDKEVRKDHAAAAREGWKFFEDEFDATGTTRPGVGPASQVVNCRCRARYSSRAKNKPTGAKPTPKVTTTTAPATPKEKTPSDIYEEGMARVRERTSGKLGKAFGKVESKFGKERDELNAELEKVRFKAMTQNLVKVEMGERLESLEEKMGKAEAAFKDLDKKDPNYSAKLKKMEAELDEIKSEYSGINVKYNEAREARYAIMEEEDDILDRRVEINIQTRKMSREELIKAVGDPKAKAIPINSTHKDLKAETNNFKNLEEGATFVGQMVTGDRLEVASSLKFKATKDRRSFAQGRWVELAYGATDGSRAASATVIHEIMHPVENYADGGRIQNRSVAFIEKRQIEKYGIDKKTGGPAGYEKLGGDFGDDEKAFEDSWVERGGSAYTGKMYDYNPDAKSFDERNEHVHGTELLSMGVQRMYENPKDFYEQDREHFEFTLANIQGDFEE